ncbi:Uncharacterized conserved protein, DUF427 family [Gillisia sp. Hel1_33_143]|uniref:DUF427 domain-containing protein n=1 Tax=unclassified Gillisia TaxID=2615025 RepID=UPI000553A224|nr:MULTISPECIES: DUF427 domain-containing protein [unclassified Gillisia]SDS15367.1 Uncharacterized conserved protein, DUF427 family [Gillisia sp. Hel1_33_143]
MKAIWNNTVIAESNDTKIVENNHYFPKESIKSEFFNNSDTTSRCPWKGVASYYNVTVGDKINKDAAWYYPNTSHAAKPIENYVAFWKEIKVTE